jgi:hypothetical protein
MDAGGRVGDRTIPVGTTVWKPAGTTKTGGGVGNPMGPMTHEGIGAGA